MWFRNVLMANEEGDGGSSGGGSTTTTAPPPSDQPPSGDGTGTNTPPPNTVTPVKAEEGRGYWPQDWTEKMSKGDDKRKSALSRYASPEAMADALIAAQNKIRSGELKTALPKDAKPEEVTAWRAENGIPESPEKYDLSFSSGLVIGAEDKPVIDAFLKTAHGQNMHPDQAKSTIEWYYQEQERQTEARITKDKAESAAASDSLHAEYGNKYRDNINAMNGFLDTFPESVRDSLKGARLPDGTGLFNHPDIVRGFVAAAIEVNPSATIVPGGGGDAMKGVSGRIDQIEKTMRENRSAYNKDEKMQAEYRQLLETREKLEKRKV